MLRHQEIDINSVELDELYILDIWNPEPDNEDDETYWRYNVRFVEKEDNIFIFEKMNNEIHRYVKIDMDSDIDSTTHKLYKPISSNSGRSSPLSRMSPVQLRVSPIRHGGKKRKRTKKSKKIRKKSKTAKRTNRTKRAKKTKRRNNKRK
jgi:hypothetical protein